MLKSNNKYRIFISYAHIDNKSIDGSEWVSDIVTDIDILLAQKLGRKEYFDIWFDKDSLGGNIHLTDELKNRIRKSDIFIMILSQGYIHSHWCREELKIFFEKNSQNSVKSNIFTIHKDNLSLNIRPIEIEDIIGYNFWYKDTNGTTRTLSKDKKEEYQASVAKVVNDIVKYLPPIKQRKSEIEQYIQHNDFNMATKRIMDLANEFSKNEDKKIAIEIRVAFNKLLKDRTEAEGSIELKKKLLNFINTITYLDSGKKIEKQDNYFEAKRKFEEKEEIVFKANQITKQYEKFHLEPISLELKYSEITALVGENSNGKTTLLNIIAGKTIHENGTIKYPLLNNGKKNDWCYIKNKIAYITQELSPWKGCLKDNLHFTLGINGVKGKENIDEVEFIIHRLGLEKYSNRTWNEISGGFKMRFSLAKALLRKPKLLILDEPLANLDIGTQNLFLSDLKNISSSIKNKMAVIISSQNIYEIEGIADNIIFLDNGKNLYSGKIKDFGDNISENSYEFNVDIEEKELLIILNEILFSDIKREGQNYILRTGKDITYDILLNLFLSYKVPIKYFRDISKSTRQLFGGLK